MSEQTEALRLADELDVGDFDVLTNYEAAAELRRLEHNNEVLMSALWKACGDDKQVVNDTIESQGALR